MTDKQTTLLNRQIILDVISAVERLLDPETQIVLPLTTHFSAVCLLDELKELQNVA